MSFGPPRYGPKTTAKTKTTKTSTKVSQSGTEITTTSIVETSNAGKARASGLRAPSKSSLPDSRTSLGTGSGARFASGIPGARAGSGIPGARTGSGIPGARPSSGIPGSRLQAPSRSNVSQLSKTGPSLPPPNTRLQVPSRSNVSKLSKTGPVPKYTKVLTAASSSTSGLTRTGSSKISMGSMGIIPKITITKATSKIGGTKTIDTTSTTNLGKPGLLKPGVYKPSGSKPGGSKSGAGKKLVIEAQNELYKNAKERPNRNLKATSTRRTMATLPVIMTDDGPVETIQQIISEKTVTRSPGLPEIVSRNITGVESVGGGKGMRTETLVSKLSPVKSGADVQVDKEVIRVKDTILIGVGGVKQTTHSVTYDTDKAPEAPPRPLTPLQVSQMIAEESEDVDNAKDLHCPDLAASKPTTFIIHKQIQPMHMKQNSVLALEQSIINPFPSPDEEHEEPQPEMLASILHTEENGLTMDSLPGKVYNHLFPGSTDESMMRITSVAPAPLQDVVVPRNAMPDPTQDQKDDPDVLQASIAASSNAEQPQDNAYALAAPQPRPPPKNTARKGKRKKQTEIAALVSELPPWGIKDYEPIVDLVGAPPAGTFVGVADNSFQEINPAEGIEYMLRIEGPAHSSRVQLRGTQKPPWFPGYYLATPEIPEIITLAKTPSEVLAAAWKATQPNIFPENSFVMA